ncbi:MAG: hypothetical protein EXX96DRAFT_555971 [Benjaminiella poitrasii]|nr:MAG: hypothetical protein EXX96DRAFT_555971 [Benjaminiella poitrasii]
MNKSDHYDYVLDNHQDTNIINPNNGEQQPYQEANGSSHNTDTISPLPNTKERADFKRRKNWSERILVELTGLLHVLSPTGRILYCSESTFALTGYRPHQLIGQSMMDFLHVDDMDVFIRDFQMAFHIQSPVKTYYRFRKQDDSYVIFEVAGQPSADRQAFFGMAQPMPTRSGSMLDSFLELKAEHDWLKKRIEEVSLTVNQKNNDAVAVPEKPQQPSNNQQQQQHLNQNDIISNSNSNNNNGNGSNISNNGYHYHQQQQQPQQLNQHTSSGLMVNEDHESDNENQHYILSSSYKHEDLLLPSSITSATTTIVTSKRTDVDDSTEDMAHKEVTEGKDKWKRRKKYKGTEEYVCTDCGTTASPEWRKGPHGPKT